ncbi:uncharacterized protein LOC123550301 isoform X2 [Mercenaria mercenaria]|nr:uncharacterized protein LOC123550301 isoform X2 [Mercenaria mercenaria]
MSITGQPQEISTVKSSWEILDSPVPLKSESLQHPSKRKSRTLLSVSNTITSIRAESSGYSTDQHLNLSDQQTSEDTSYKHISSTRIKPTSQTLNPELDSTGRLKTEDSISQEHIRNRLEEVQKEPNSRGTATYVSSQRRPTEDIAETIATEFEKHVRKSHRPIKRELDTEDAANIRYLQDQLIKEDTESTAFHQFAHEETVLSNTSGMNDPNSKLQSRGISEGSNSNVIDTRSPDSRDYSEISRETSSTAYQGQISCSIASVHHSENSGMSHVSLDRPRHLVNNRHASERRLYRNPQGERPRPAETMNNQYHNEDQRYPPHEAHNYRPTFQDSQSSSRYLNNVRFPQIQVDDIAALKDEDRRDHTPRGDSVVSNAAKSMSEVVDHPHVPAPTEEDAPFPRQTIPLANAPLPTFHPPPTIIQNGISQADLLELMSKGLGQFTTEMTVMVLEKLKPEYEALAKQVGEEVKESTITELKDLRGKLTASEAEVKSLKVERDNLKTENSKERDQMKKEFEKDRLKRVKEFEEKKELIDNLQKENEQFKSLLKEKDKMLKKADGKAKSEEQKRIKFEEESGKKQKELQKELDKIKGELLVQKSKKRLQVSSASKKECLGKLNSQHGLYPRQFNGHKPIPYDEGDD